MIRIADFDDEGMPFLFVGTTAGGRFVFQHVWPQSLLALMKNMPLEEIVTFGGIHQQRFAGAIITSAISAGTGGVELTVEM